MAICFYYKNDVKINSIQELITEFFKDNNQLRNAAIFSSQDIQESTHKKLLAIPGINAYDASSVPVVTEYIVQQNPGRYNQLGIVTKDGRLVPEYIEENRIYSYVKENASTVENLPDGVDVTGVPYTPEKLRALKKNTDLGSLSDNKLILLLSKIEELITFEEKVKDFGILIHSIVSLKHKGDPYSGIIDKYLTNPKNAEVIGSFSPDEWARKIDQIADSILTKVQDIGLPISEIAITTDVLKGKIDLLAIDLSGAVHIFELKVSKTKYSDWDSAKKITLDRQLSLYRQLLGQHVLIDDTMLYTIPVWMDGLGDPNRIYVEPLAERRSESHSGLNSTGRFTTEANLILPRKIIRDFDPARVDKLTNDLHKLLGPDYKVETGAETYDEEKLMEKARERYKREHVWKFINDFDDAPGLKMGTNQANSEDELRAQIKIYVAHASKFVNKNVSDLKDAIATAVKTGRPVKTNSFDVEKDITVNHLLFSYLNGDWEVIHNVPEATLMGLILLKNKTTGNVNVISLTSNELYAKSEVDSNTYGDLEFLKTFLFLNEFKEDLFPGGSGRVAQVIIYNPLNKKSYFVNSRTKFSEFNKRMHKEKMGSNMKLSTDDILGIDDIALYNLNENFRNFSGSEKEEIDVLFAPFENTNLAMIDIDILLDIQKAFYEKWPEYKINSTKPTINFSDTKEMIAALLNVAITTKNGLDVAGDFQGLTEFSLQFSDFRSLVAALYTNKQSDYDKTGKKIQGIVGGLVWSPPDWVASKDLKNINHIMSVSNEHIGQWMVSVSEKIHATTIPYYKAIRFSETEQNWSGETQSKYKNLWAQSTDGKVLDDFKTKNPYMNDLDNQMTDDERNYLKKMLLIINTWTKEITEADAEKLDHNDINSLMTNAVLKKAIEDGTYFEMPLIRREEITRFKGAVASSGKLWKDKIKPYVSEIKDYLDTRELQKGDLSSIELQKMGFYEMYDVYGRQSQAFKAKAIEERTIEYFEWNLDTIAHRVAFNKIRKKILDRKLPIINSYIWWIKMLAGQQNVNISKQLEYVANQMKLSVFDEPLVNEEFKDLTTAAAVVKHFSTAAMLAFKPASFIKEMTIGAFRGIMMASTKIYGKDQFELKDLMTAYKKLSTIDNKFSNEFNLIDKLNAYYRFANMDVNSISKKLQTDRRGLFRGFGRYMYMCNTVPDYYNRLSILIAKMVHDGSYDAHTLVDGVFQYDATKDNRFSYYLANRSKHMLGDKYVAATNDIEYNKQRQRYLLLVSQLNIEYKGERVFEEANIVPKAYSEIERSSLKSFSDMAYGYYDKDAQAQINNHWYGMVWMQFMQFWPGKMKMWFAKPTDESPMGRMEQDFVMEDGVKKLQWFKTEIDENGVPKPVVTDENTGDPVLKWVGTPYEGLMYSVLGTIKDLATLDFKHIKDSEERNRRVAFALSDAVLMFLLLGLAKIFFDAYIAENGSEGVSGTLVGMTAAVNKKVLNEFNLWQSTGGAISTEPVFVSWGKKMGGDVWDALNGDKEMMDLLKRNVGAAEVFKW